MVIEEYFGLGLHLVYVPTVRYVCVRSEGSGETAHLYSIILFALARMILVRFAKVNGCQLLHS